MELLYFNQSKNLSVHADNTTQRIKRFFPSQHDKILFHTGDVSLIDYINHGILPNFALNQNLK